MVESCRFIWFHQVHTHILVYIETHTHIYISLYKHNSCRLNFSTACQPYVSSFWLNLLPDSSAAVILLYRQMAMALTKLQAWSSALVTAGKTMRILNATWCFAFVSMSLFWKKFWAYHYKFVDHDCVVQPLNINPHDSIWLYEIHISPQWIWWDANGSWIHMTPHMTLHDSTWLQWLQWLHKIYTFQWIHMIYWIYQQFMTLHDSSHDSTVHKSTIHCINPFITLESS